MLGNITRFRNFNNLSGQYYELRSQLKSCRRQTQACTLENAFRNYISES